MNLKQGIPAADATNFESGRFAVKGLVVAVDMQDNRSFGIDVNIYGQVVCNW
jgi:hypothetical protein